VAKLLTYGNTRAQAVSRMRQALDETVLEGISSTIPLHRKLMDEPGFTAGGFNIHHLEHLFEQGFSQFAEISHER